MRVLISLVVVFALLIGYGAWRQHERTLEREARVAAAQQAAREAALDSARTAARAADSARAEYALANRSRYARRDSSFGASDGDRVNRRRDSVRQALRGDAGRRTIVGRSPAPSNHPR